MCKARGEIVRLQHNSSEGQRGGAVVCCPVCAGRGFHVVDPCSACGGHGLAQRPRRVAFRVPAGVDSGSLLRLPGQGSVSRVGGPRGAVVLEVQARSSCCLPPAAGSWLHGARAWLPVGWLC
jgi:DnaJ-class molecular chaperone